MRTATLAALLTLSSLSLSAQDDDINWLGSYAEALKAAKETGKPIVLEYRCEP